MVSKVSCLLEKIKRMENKNNTNVILGYYNYLVEKGLTLNSQGASLGVIYYYATFLGDTNLRDVKEKSQITPYLNTLIKYDDPDKKYISTYNIYLIRLVGFFRWLYNYENDEKQESFWITPDFAKIRRKQTKRLTPYSNTEIWEKEEIQSIIKYEQSIRNKAIISLLWDLDARPHEVTQLKIKNLRLREKYGEGEIPFNTKTGSGPILLTFSFPYVRDWLNIHPDRHNNEAFVICTRHGTNVTTIYIYDVMLRLKNRIKRLVITGSISDQREKERLEYFLNTKKWNPYCIRHSAITADSDYLPEYALKKKVRWSMNSQQGRRYIKNRMGEELRNKILEQNGIVLDTELKPKPTNISCPRCDLVNQIENKYCSKCSYPLSPQAFDEIKKEEDARFKELDEKYSKEMAETKRILETLMQNIDYTKLKP